MSTKIDYEGRTLVISTKETCELFKGMSMRQVLEQSEHHQITTRTASAAHALTLAAVAPAQNLPEAEVWISAAPAAEDVAVAAPAPPIAVVVPPPARIKFKTVRFKDPTSTYLGKQKLAARAARIGSVSALVPEAEAGPSNGFDFAQPWADFFGDTQVQTFWKCPVEHCYDKHGGKKFQNAQYARHCKGCGTESQRIWQDENESD